MTTRAQINDFLGQHTLAVVGVSRGGKKFGNAAFKELKSKGHTVFPVNPHADVIENEKCYPGLAALPQPVGGVVIVVPPVEAEQVVRQAAEAGIKRVWLQQGSESDGAIRCAEEHNMTVIHGHCILMFAEPAAFPHRAHRFFRNLAGRVPH